MSLRDSTKIDPLRNILVVLFISFGLLVILIYYIIGIARGLSNASPEDSLQKIIAIVMVALALASIITGLVIAITIKNRRKKEREIQNNLKIEGLSKEEYLKKKEEEERSLKEKKENERLEQKTLHKQIMKISEEQREEPKVIIRKPKVVNDERLQKLTYNGSFNDEKCMICKLELRKEQLIVKCPFCQALFHKKHLAGWLEKQKDCPICSEKILK